MILHSLDEMEAIEVGDSDGVDSDGDGDGDGDGESGEEEGEESSAGTKPEVQQVCMCSVI